MNELFVVPTYKGNPVAPPRRADVHSISLLPDGKQYYEVGPAKFPVPVEGDMIDGVCFFDTDQTFSTIVSLPARFVPRLIGPNDSVLFDFSSPALIVTPMHSLA